MVLVSKKIPGAHVEENSPLFWEESGRFVLGSLQQGFLDQMLLLRSQLLGELDVKPDDEVAFLLGISGQRHAFTGDNFLIARTVET